MLTYYPSVNMYSGINVTATESKTIKKNTKAVLLAMF